MLQESQDLLDEAGELHAFLETFDDADWQRPTGFKSWTPWDVVAHLHFFDEVSMLSLEGEGVTPMTKEALMLHSAWKVDSQMVEALDFIDSDVNEGDDFTAWDPTLRRRYYTG